MAGYGERLDQAMSLAGKTRKDLADAIGVSYQAVRLVLLGKSVALTAENSARAARFLKVDHHWLATGEGEPRPKPILSPLGLDLARAFDGVPVERRNEVYAHLMYAIDLATGTQRAIALADAPAIGQLQTRS